MKAIAHLLLKSRGATRRSVSRLHRATHSALLLLASVLMLCLALPKPATAAVLEGSQPKDWPANPAKHQVTVRRVAADAKQAAMIAAAEAVEPSKEALRQAAGDAAVPAGDKVWWCREELGIRIPCAITAAAVAYYSDLVGKFGKQNLKRFVEPSSRLDYHAGVKFHPQFKLGEKTFDDVHVVTLKLTFSQNFVTDPTAGMQFEKERVVILDVSGKVLLVTGDGPTEVPVLMI